MLAEAVHARAGAAWAAIEYPDADVRCITFGSPRVANRKFKKAFHGLVGTSLRLAYGGDPVPNFPSYRWALQQGASARHSRAGLAGIWWSLCRIVCLWPARQSQCRV